MRALQLTITVALAASAVALTSCSSTAPSDADPNGTASSRSNANTPVLGNSPQRFVTAPPNNNADSAPTAPSNSPSSAPAPPRPPLATDIPPVEPVDLPWNFCVVYAQEPGRWVAPRGEPAIQYLLDRTTAHLTQRGVETISYAVELQAARAARLGNTTGDYGINENYLIPADVFVEVNLKFENLGPTERIYVVTVNVTHSCSSRIWATAVAESDVVVDEAAGIAQATDRAIARIIPRLEAERAREIEKGREYRVLGDAGRSLRPDALEVLYDALDDVCREVKVVNMNDFRGEFSIWVDPELASVDVFRLLVEYCRNAGVYLSDRHIFRQVLVLDVE